MFRFSDVLTLTLVRATIRMSTPILLAALGVIVTELAAITNVGIEGIMLVSAFMAVAASYWSGSWIVGILAAVAAGVLIAALMALIHLRFKANVLVAGIAVNMFSLAFTRFLLVNWFGVAGSFYSPGSRPYPASTCPSWQPIRCWIPCSTTTTSWTTWGSSWCLCSTS